MLPSSQRSQPPPIALTMGDPAGIGGEITLKAWQQRTPTSPVFAVLDDPRRLERLASRLELTVPIIEIDDPEQAVDSIEHGLPVYPIALQVDVEPGVTTPAAADAVLASIEAAVQFAKKGRVSSVVTNPIQKASLYDAGFGFPGHTEFLAHLTGGSRPVMMLVGEDLRTVPVTIHQPLATVVDSLTAELIVETATITARALQRDFGISDPRLAIAGLNPHAGEHGSLGREDIEIIKPAIATLRELGIDASGPRSADTLFHKAARQTYDAALGMYHDQALIPIKTLSFETGVNATLGLPIVRTSPDHGTALEIAGTGTANPSSLVAAITLAAEMASNRALYDKAAAEQT